MVNLFSFKFINCLSFIEVVLIKKGGVGERSLTHKKDSGLKNSLTSSKTQTHFFFHRHSLSYLRNCYYDSTYSRSLDSKEVYFLLSVLFWFCFRGLFFSNFFIAFILDVNSISLTALLGQKRVMFCSLLHLMFSGFFFLSLQYCLCQHHSQY